MRDVVRIRPMTAHDAADVVAIDPHAFAGDVSRAREELARAWSRQWVADEAGRGVVAFLVAWHVADELHVLHIATREDRRRRGMGRALVDTAVSYARDHSVTHALLEVRRSNEAALALYRSTGFVATGVRPRYYPDDEDAIEMRLALASQTPPP